MYVHRSRMQVLHMFRICSLWMEKEKDWACGTCMCKSSTSACMYLLFSCMECSVEMCRCSFMHKQWNTFYKCLATVLTSSSDQSWPFCILIWHYYVLCLCEVQLKALHSITRGLFGRVNKESSLLNMQLPVLSESSMSTMECLTSWDMVKRKPPGTTGGRATAQHLHHAWCMFTHTHKRGFSACAFFNLHWQTLFSVCSMCLTRTQSSHLKEGNLVLEETRLFEG